MNNFEDASYQHRSAKCDKCERIFIKNKRSERFCPAVSDRSALRNLAMVFAEDVERNLVGELPLSAIVQIIAGNLVEVKQTTTIVGR
jgi:hypothetical protein